MEKLTTYERMMRTYNHQDADRIPIVDYPWGHTQTQWVEQGMPSDIDWRTYFGIDLVNTLGVDITPRYEQRLIEETDTYTIKTTKWGATLKYFKDHETTPEFIDFKVKTPDDWREAKALMTPTEDRIDWQRIDALYKASRKAGAWIEAGFWFGFDVTHSWFVGTERVLIAMIENPEWLIEMFNHYLDMDIALFERVWDAGYHFDSVSWPDDMGYKGTAFFSIDMYRELLKPVQKRAIDWAHSKGVKTRLHSCGNIMKLVPDLVELGLDCLHPLEFKAGMDALALKEKYGDRLALHGGMNCLDFSDREKFCADIDTYVPALMKNGGYVCASDHSIPSTVSLEDIKYIVARMKKVGSYN